jgi:hypothetical protein
MLMLSVLVGLMVMGCSNGDDNGDDGKGNSYNGKTVDEKYRGEWYSRDSYFGEESPYRRYILTKTECHSYDVHFKDGLNRKEPAWTDGNILWILSSATNTEYKIGEFEDDSTLREYNSQQVLDTNYILFKK